MDFSRIVDFIYSISFESWILFASLFGNFIFVIFKLKGSKFEKDYKRALKNAAKNKYYLYAGNKYYTLDQVKFVPIESISNAEYQLKKGGD